MQQSKVIKSNEIDVTLLATF